MAVDWDEVAAGRVDRTYELLRRSIVRNQVADEAVTAFGALGGSESAARARAAVDQLGRRNDTRPLLQLHELLMGMPANSDLLYGSLRRQFSAALEKAEARPRIRGRTFAWPVTTAILAAAAAHRTTGDPRFVRLMTPAVATIVEHRDPNLDRADDVRGQPSRGWVSAGLWRSRRAGKQKDFTTTISVTGRIVLGLATFADVVGGEETLSAEHHLLAAQALECLAPALSDLEAEFVDLGDGRAYYRRPFANEPEPLNHMASAGEAMLLLGRLGAGAEWTERAAAMAQYLEASIFRQESGVFGWHYAPLPDDRRAGKAEAFWKARITAGFIQACAEEGVVFSPEWPQHLAATFAANVFRANGEIGSTVLDGAPKLEAYAGHAHKPFASLIAMYGFGRQEPNISAAIERLVASRPDAGGWFGETISSIGYAARLEAQSGAAETHSG